MPPFEMDIERNLDGTISRKIETCNGKSHQWDFEYDEAGRLTRALLDHGTAFWCEYDREGRRDRDVVTFRKDKARSYAYGLDNRLQAAGNIRFEHDQAGFRCGRIQPDGQSWRYHYNPDYQLLGATLPDGRVLSYAHDEEGRRIGKYVNGQLVEAYEWENFLQMSRFADPLGVAEFRYEPGQRMPSAMVRNGTEYALYYDQIGSFRAVADPFGNMVKNVLYSPFGAVIEDTNPGFSVPFGFAGGLFDRDLGFVRFGWRDYDTDTARWTAKDPIGAAGDDRDWYGYCLDDPVNGNDPGGLKTKIHYYPGTFGHISIAPGGAEATGKYPKGFGDELDGDGAIRKETEPSYEDCDIDSTPEQEALMQKQIEKNQSNPNLRYNLTGDNCITFVDEVLKSGGFKTPEKKWNTFPREYYNGLGDICK